MACSLLYLYALLLCKHMCRQMQYMHTVPAGPQGGQPSQTVLPGTSSGAGLALSSHSSLPNHTVQHTTYTFLDAHGNVLGTSTQPVQLVPNRVSTAAPQQQLRLGMKPGIVPQVPAFLSTQAAQQQQVLQVMDVGMGAPRILNPILGTNPTPGEPRTAVPVHSQSSQGSAFAPLPSSRLIPVQGHSQTAAPQQMQVVAPGLFTPAPPIQSAQGNTNMASLSAISATSGKVPLAGPASVARIPKLTTVATYNPATGVRLPTAAALSNVVAAAGAVHVRQQQLRQHGPANGVGHVGMLQQQHALGQQGAQGQGVVQMSAGLSALSPLAPSAMLTLHPQLHQPGQGHGVEAGMGLGQLNQVTYIGTPTGLPVEQMHMIQFSQPMTSGQQDVLLADRTGRHGNGESLLLPSVHAHGQRGVPNACYHPAAMHLITGSTASGERSRTPSDMQFSREMPSMQFSNVNAAAYHMATQHSDHSLGNASGNGHMLSYNHMLSNNQDASQGVAVSEGDMNAILVSIGQELARSALSVEEAIAAGLLGVLSPNDVAVLTSAHAEQHRSLSVASLASAAQAHQAQSQGMSQHGTPDGMQMLAAGHALGAGGDQGMLMHAHSGASAFGPSPNGQADGEFPSVAGLKPMLMHAPRTLLGSVFSCQLGAAMVSCPLFMRMY